MEAIEITATTVEQAIKKAEEQLGLSRDEFKVEVVRQGRSGILGVGAREATIRVTPTTAPEPDAANGVAEILTTLLGLMGVQGKVETSSAELPLAFNIVGDDLGILIGRHGQTLAALEYVTKLIAVRRLGTWLPLTLDVGGYRKHRREALQKLALYLAEQVKSKHRAVPMEPMPADERRIIHLTLADHPDVTTQSIGEGENRKVVILPKEG